VPDDRGLPLSVGSGVQQIPVALCLLLEKPVSGWYK